ncbi:Phosphatidylinositol kinase (PIK-G3) [Plasmopara halstedii]|uniref:1-phosphatidylinositol 4-kinase n=1 Tax=Plasmopara halstedii TaxID=4781 RepID=A0A0P1AXX7_PLAHL|nr:Phosphatidylinositol kinase (PIK-G3) [Plasmopara halstedii]CEG45551.1 Phosphatidylinositol kinase (PIK-G3) [Plasmopara halstedii]|eukprot:XP_024581920.1 Phosphatidylinositol kinase (PIK-G3) [Plasmopara halstedii]
MTYSNEYMKNYKKIAPFNVYLVDDGVVQANGTGDIVMSMKTPRGMKKGVLTSVWHIPKLSRNLFSARRSTKDVGPVTFERDGCFAEVKGLRWKLGEREGKGLFRLCMKPIIPDEANVTRSLGCHEDTTSPDLAAAVGVLSQFATDPCPTHWQALKRVLRYIQGTKTFGIKFQATSEEGLQGYSDADWAGDIETRRSTSGYAFMMNGGCISWKSKKQRTVALSSTEAEYMALTEATQEAIWLKTFLCELGEMRDEDPVKIFEDNQGSLALAKNPKFHKRTKHIDIRYHFVREKVEGGQVILQYCSIKDMKADMITKPITAAQFDFLPCERLPFYTETCVDRVENLWYQLLHLVQCLDAEPAPLSVVQLFYLQRYIRAICRRCPRIALQTIWHVQASVGDGNDHNLHPHTLLALLGFIYPNTTLPESSRVFSIWKDLVFADCPEHQLAQILADLREINSQMERMILLEPDSMIERWLNARSVPEFKDCAAELMASGIELCEFQSNILYDSLDIETDILGDESSGSAIESLVLEQVSFVQSLAAISERLRHVQPITDRSKYLAGELETLNNTLQSSALYPLSAASDELYQVVRIPPTEGKVFSTKMRAPTLIFVETVPVRRSGSLGTHDPKADHLRPFVFSSQPRNSTFFESARSDDIETSAVCSGGDGMLSPYMKSTLIPPTPGSSADGPTTCSDNSYSARDKCSACDLDEDVRQQDSLLSRNARRHTGVMPQSSRGIKMGTGARTRRLGGENFVYNSKVFGESWEDRKARIQHESPMGKLPGWNLFSVIVKTNDDLRQEVFTMQLIHKLQSIFEFEAPHLWLRTYRIVATGANIGLLETITDACSLDHLKKTFPGGNLLQYFRSVYGDPSSADFLAAQRRFIESMAAYSLVSYVLLLKDRHNGNILLSSEGRIIHIDFGFILGIAPGGIFSLEDAPFKLTKEMVDVMGGLSSPGYLYFRRCLYEGILVLQKYEAEIVALLQTTGQHSPFPCFHGTKLTRVISSLRSRLCVGLSRRGTQICVDYLLRKSYNSWGTRKYDSFQFRSNNIYM